MQFCGSFFYTSHLQVDSNCKFSRSFQRLVIFPHLKIWIRNVENFFVSAMKVLIKTCWHINSCSLFSDRAAKELAFSPRAAGRSLVCVQRFNISWSCFNKHQPLRRTRLLFQSFTYCPSDLGEVEQFLIIAKRSTTFWRFVYFWTTEMTAPSTIPRNSNLYNFWVS